MRSPLQNRRQKWDSIVNPFVNGYLAGEGLSGRYPLEVQTKRRLALSLTPMVASDWLFLKRFLNAVPEDERHFLRHDVTEPSLIEHWCAHVNYAHVLPILAWHGDTIVANATLHREPGLWTAHLGKLRLLIHPEYRAEGIGTALVRHLVDLAAIFSLHKLVAECPVEQLAFIAFLQRFQFAEVARLEGFIRDKAGTFHDMVVLVRDVQSPYSD